MQVLVSLDVGAAVTADMLSDAVERWTPQCCGRVLRVVPGASQVRPAYHPKQLQTQCTSNLRNLFHSLPSSAPSCALERCMTRMRLTAALVEQVLVSLRGVDTKEKASKLSALLAEVPGAAAPSPATPRASPLVFMHAWQHHLPQDHLLPPLQGWCLRRSALRPRKP